MLNQMKDPSGVRFWAFAPPPLLGNILSFPIKHSGSPQEFGFILDRIKGKLAGWKENLLYWLAGFF